VKVLQDRRNTFWTCTSWESEAAMKAFMLAKPHGPTMQKLLEWCDEAALVHWSQAEPELPTWTEAHQRMQREGRTSKVKHPSEAHRKFVLAPPPANPRTEARLK
jgi:heme-degrading monooxygenase HmoA